MREFDEYSDDALHSRDTGTEVEDSKNHLITPEERDRIIREYNAERKSEQQKKQNEIRPKIEEEPDRTLDCNETAKKTCDALEPKQPIVRKEEHDSEGEPCLEDVRKLYIEDGLSLKKIGEQFGFKSGTPIKRILEAAGEEIRPVGFQVSKEIDPDEVYRLYFEEGWNLKDVVAHFDCKSSDPIHRVFKEHGWKTRQQVSYQKEIDPEEVFRLYNEEGLSHRKIGEHFGVSDGPIRRIFKEHGMPYDRFRTIQDKTQINPEDLHYFYFELGLSKEATCEALGISKRPFDRILKENGWEARPIGFQKIEINIDEFKRLYYEEGLHLYEIAKLLGVSNGTLRRFRKEHKMETRENPTIIELRDSLFGTDCEICGKPKKFIHRKDGQFHPTEILWNRKKLLKLNLDDWVALCRPCHRLTHSLMRNFGCEWDEIEKTLKEVAEKK